MLSSIRPDPVMAADQPPQAPRSDPISAPRRVLWATLGWGGTGASVGLVLGSITARANPSIRPAHDVLVVSLLLGLVGALLFLVPGVLTSFFLLAPARRNAASSNGGSPWLASHLVAAVVFYSGYLAAQLAISYLPQGWRAEGDPLRFWASVGTGWLASLGTGWFLLRTRIDRLQLPLLAAIVAAALLALGSAFTLDGEGGSVPAPEPLAPTEPRSSHVVLLGLDGADWARIRPLFEQGRLPNLQRLCESGVTAPLRTTVPTWSPIVWTTIASGVREERHGILDFTEVHLPGMDLPVQRLRGKALLPQLTGVIPLADQCLRLGLVDEVPISARPRRFKTLWNVLSDQERTVGVVNWFATWPSETVNGFIVSDNNPWRHAFLSGKHGHVQSLDYGITYPPALMAELVPLIAGADASSSGDGDGAAILALPFFDDLDATERAELEHSPFLSTFRLFSQTDRFAASAGLHLWREKAPEFLAVYWSGIDNTSHRIDHPEVIDRYYEYCDGLIGEYMALADDHTTFILVSDHGWNYGESLRGHNHGPDGILAMSGWGVRRGVELAQSPSILDIAPTVLALLGLPASEEMQGEAIRAALLPQVLESLPADRPASWGTHHPQWFGGSQTAGSADATDETLRKLRELGYIK
jgi:hypothetical protein